jgi:hypothetical protein
MKNSQIARAERAPSQQKYRSWDSICASVLRLVLHGYLLASKTTDRQSESHGFRHHCLDCVLMFFSKFIADVAVYFACDRFRRGA